MIRISKDKENPKVRERKTIEGRVLLAFAMELCEMQNEQGRIFLFEHPKLASSWQEPCVVKSSQLGGIE